jgi:uncharacterized protein YjbI with pentapeptide repeats
MTLAGEYLSHADLTGYPSPKATCAVAVLTRRRFLVATSARRFLRTPTWSADLRGCSFAGATLAGANLFEADLCEGAQISRDRAGEFYGRGPSNPHSTANGAAFSGADLTNASLAGVFSAKTDFQMPSCARLPVDPRPRPRRQFCWI